MRSRWREAAYDGADPEISQHLDSYVGAICGLPEGQMGNSEVGHMNMARVGSCTWTLPASTC